MSKLPSSTKIYNEFFEITESLTFDDEGTVLPKYNESHHEAPVGELDWDIYLSLHFHDHYEFFFFKGEECEFLVDGFKHTLHFGDILLIPPFSVHCMTKCDPDNYRRIILSFTDRMIADYSNAGLDILNLVKRLKEKRHYMIQLPLEGKKDIDYLLQKTIREIADNADHREIGLFANLLGCFNLIAYFIGKNDVENTADKRLFNMLAFIEDNLSSRDLTLETIAAAFHINKYYLSHYFKDNIGIPLYRYINYNRLALATKYLTQGKPINEVVTLSGFSDYSNFYRLFVKEFSENPTEYLKKYRAGLLE